VDSTFISLFYKTFSGFNCLLRALVSSKTKAKDFLPGTDLASKQTFFCYFIFGNCPTICSILIVLLTIMAPKVDLPALLTTILLLCTGKVAIPLVFLISPNFSIS
jgi:hypothetical protein